MNTASDANVITYRIHAAGATYTSSVIAPEFARTDDLSPLTVTGYWVRSYAPGSVSVRKSEWVPISKVIEVVR